MTTLPTTTSSQAVIVGVSGFQFPRQAWQRWLLRIGFTLPYALLAIFADSAKVHIDTATPNELLLQSAASLPHAFSLDNITSYFPPLTNGAAVFLPSTLALGILGAAVAGWFLAELLRVLVLAGVRVSHTVVGIIAVGVNPIFALVAIYDLPATAATLFFGIALIDTFRFVSRGDTRAGFRSGIYLLLASLSSWSGLLFTVMASIAAPLLLQARSGKLWGRVSNTIVLLFPTVATFGAVMLLTLAFNGRPFQILQDAITYSPMLWDVFPQLFTTPTGWLVAVPFFLFSVFAALMRRPNIIVLGVLLLAVILLGKVFGLIPTATVGQTFLVTFMIGVSLVVEIGRIKLRGIVWVYWTLLAIAAWILPIFVPALSHYLTAVFGPLFGA